MFADHAGPEPSTAEPSDASLLAAAEAVFEDLQTHIAPGVMVPGEGGDPAAHNAILQAELALLAFYGQQIGWSSVAQAESYLQCAVDLLGRSRLPSGLHGGFCEIAWIAQRLGFGDESSFEEIDETLWSAVRDVEGDYCYDVIQGLAGIGTYLLERRSSAPAAEALSLVSAHLKRLARSTGDGTTWLTPPAVLIPSERAIAPDGYYALGMAHGVAGIVAFLAHCEMIGATGPDTASLLDGAVRWLLAQCPADPDVPYSRYVHRGIRGGAPLQGWCWGTLGIAWALYQAGCALDSVTWRARAVAIARAVAERGRNTSRDACLCHGATGIGHLFRKFFQATHESVFRAAAARSYEHVLALRTGGAFGGFSFDISNASRKGMGDSPRLMFGATGVALGLLAAADKTDAAWDRLMLLSPA